MVLSLSASFKDAVAQGGHTPVILADFDLGGSLGTYRLHNFAGILSGHTSSNNAILSSVTNISRKVDPITRKTSSGTMTLEVVDEGTIRNWAGRFSLFNKKVHIKLGFDGVATGDFLTVFVGVITEILPGEGVIVIKLADEIFNLERRKFGGNFIGKHPLEVAKQLIEYGAETTSTTAADFNPANYSSSISHYSMTSVSMRSFYETRAETMEQAEREGADTTYAPIGTGRTGNFFGQSQSIGNAPTFDNRFVSVRPIIDEIAQFVGVTFYVDETGSIRAKVYDSSAASVRTLTADDYDSLDQTNQYGGVVNQIIINVANSQQSATFTRKDANSITAVGEKALKLTAAHLAPVSLISKTTAFSSLSNFTLETDGGMVTGFCGTRGTIAVVSSPTDGYLHTPATNAGLSGTRLSTYAIAELSASRGALFQATAAATINFHDAGVMERVAHFSNVNNDGSSGGGTIKAVQNVRFSMGHVGGATIATDEADVGDRSLGMEIIDCTIIKRFADDILTRFARGGITVEFRTSLRHVDLQLGDFVDFDTDKLLMDGADFNDTSSVVTAKFEIVEKELDMTSDVPSVKFTASQVTISTAPALSIGDVVNIPDIALIPVKPSFTFMGGGTPAFTLPPPITSSASAHEITIGRGILMRGDGSSMPIAEVEDVELPSDITVDVGYDSITGAVVTTAEGGIQSPRNASLSNIETDGSGVTATVDLSRLGSIGPKQLSETVADGFNRLKNGGFEAWSLSNSYPPDCWSMNAGTWNTDCKRIAASTVTVFEGLYALQFPSSSTRASTSLVSDYIPVSEGEVYLITAAMKKTSGSPSGEVSVSFYTNSKSTVSNNTLQTKALTTSWIRIGGAIAAPTNARFARIFIARTGASTAAYMDDVKMEIGSPGFSARISSDITIGSSTTVLDVVFDTELQDRGGMYNATTGIATAPVSGDYLITATVRIYKTGTDSDTWQVHIEENGTSFLQFGNIDTLKFPGDGVAGVAQLNLIKSFEAGDTFNIEVKRTTGGTKADNKVRAVGSTFSAKLIR